MKKTHRKRKPARTTDSKELATKMAEAALEEKGKDVVILYVADVVGYADYFIIASGASTRQTGAIAEAVVKTARGEGAKLLGVEGEREANWILVDTGSVVAHIFHQPVREFYELEDLFSDVEKIEIKDE